MLLCYRRAVIVHVCAMRPGFVQSSAATPFMFALMHAHEAPFAIPSVPGCQLAVAMRADPAHHTGAQT